MKVHEIYDFTLPGRKWDAEINRIPKEIQYIPHAGRKRSRILQFSLFLKFHDFMDFYEIPWNFMVCYFS